MLLTGFRLSETTFLVPHNGQRWGNGGDKNRGKERGEDECIMYPPGP